LSHLEKPQRTGTKISLYLRLGINVRIDRYVWVHLAIERWCLSVSL
jgi:hypothetical protein